MPQNTKDELIHRNWMTEEEASLKYCPKLEEDCLGSECMFWVWQDPEYMWAVESPGDDWIKGEEDEIFLSGEGAAKKHEWIRPRAILKGRCGYIRTF